MAATAHPRMVRMTLSPAAIRLRPIKMPAARRDVKRIAGKAAFTGQVGGKRVARDHRALWRKDVDQRTGSAALPAADRDDVAVGVEAHSFDAAVRPAMVLAERVQHRRVTGRAV